MEAMGVISYLMSLPPDWIVHVSHLRKVFRVGKNKMLKVLKELIEAGYMYRQQVRDNKGRIIGWKTKYSDIPEFIGSAPELHFRALDNRALENPALVKQPLQINNNTKKTNYKRTTQQERQPTPQLEAKEPITSQEPDPNVVVSLMEKLEQWAIAETLLRTWLRKHSAEYILEKIEYTKHYASKNPAGLLRRAIENNYKLPLAKQSGQGTKAPAEPVYPTHEENLAWYASLPDEEKLKLQKEAVHKHSMFEHHLKHQNVSVLDQDFTQNGLFKDMMRLIGRARC